MKQYSADLRERLLRAIDAGTWNPSARPRCARPPDATLIEHCATWTATTGVVVSPSTMSRALRRAGWPLKKSR